jgi:hypothetical protein
METSEFFKQLGLGDPDMEEAREWVSYTKFENAVPDILTLSEFVDSVLKKTVTDDAKPHLWFSERYMISRYLNSTNPASDDYIEQFESRITVLKSKISSDDITYKYIHKFLDILIQEIHTKRMVFSKEVLEYLNELYKGNIK